MAGLQQVSQETFRLILCHSASLCIFFELFPAYASDVRIFRFRMHEDETAYAGFRCHRVASGKAYAQTFFAVAAAVAVMAVVRMDMFTEQT